MPKPLEIILDDSELSDLTCCFDLIRFDSNVNIDWNYIVDEPYSKGFLHKHLSKSRNYLNLPLKNMDD